jgi:hypothetical protein
MMAAARVVEEFSFGPPTITPRIYLASGPSGWPETFERKRTDAELVAFLLPVPVEDVVHAFVDGHMLAAKQDAIGWHTIIGHLGRLMEVHPRKVPPGAAVAFWAHVLKRQAEVG